MSDEHVSWATSKTAFLSKRMTFRLAAKFEQHKRAHPSKRKEMPLKEIISVGLGQYDMTRPPWYPKKAELKDYNDDWDDWKPREKAVLLKRLEKGAKPETLYSIFKVPYEVAKETDRLFAGAYSGAPPLVLVDDDLPKPLGAASVVEEDVGKTKMVRTRESEEFEVGKFSDLDFNLTDDRRFANRRWLEYEQEVDLTKPANQTSVEMMITMEVAYRQARRDLQTTDKKVRDTAYAHMKVVREAYSKSADDVAMLMKRFKQAPKQENLDAVILRTHDIRPEWRDTEIERQMALRNLFSQVAEFHKTSLEDGDDEEPRELKIPEPQPPGDTNVRSKIAEHMLAKSDGEDTPMAVVSDG